MEERKKEEKKSIFQFHFSSKANSRIVKFLSSRCFLTWAPGAKNKRDVGGIYLA